MKKAPTFILGFIALIIVQVLIGEGVADSLLQIYANFSKHWIAGAFVCLLSAIVVSWLPMLFLIGPFRSDYKRELKIVMLLGVVSGLLAPLIIGFRSLGLVLSALLVLTTAVTVDGAFKAFEVVFKQLDETKRDRHL